MPAGGQHARSSCSRDHRGLQAGYRAGRGRRRAGPRLPLQPAGLPDPAAPGRLRHPSDRPDRLRPARRDGPSAGRALRPTCGARCGHRRRGVGDPRRQPGPAPACTRSGWCRGPCSTPSSPARLLGYPRVALGTMLEELLGVRLLKEHSASDWSTRPLPAGVADLRRPRCRAAARAARHAGRPAARRPARGSGPSRSSPRWWPAPGCRPSRGRTRGGVPPASTGCAPDAGWATSPSSGTPGTRSPPGWTGRPGKILADVGHQRAGRQPAPEPGRAAADPRLRPTAGPSFRGRPGWTRWSRCRQLRESELPPMHVPSDGPPQARLWPTKDPVAAARLAAVRGALQRDRRRSTSCRWRTCSPPTTSAGWPGARRRRSPRSRWTQALAGYGARPWQRELTVATITPLLADPV